MDSIDRDGYVSFFRVLLDALSKSAIEWSKKEHGRSLEGMLAYKELMDYELLVLDEVLKPEYMECLEEALKDSTQEIMQQLGIEDSDEGISQALADAIMRAAGVSPN